MGMYQPLHQHPSSPSASNGYLLSKAVFTGLCCTALCLSLLHLLCCGTPREQANVVSRLQHNNAASVDQVQDRGNGCDYSEGRWVHEPGYGRRYNGTACNVTGSVNCARNGRPDAGYVDWRWQPAGCRLPPFDAATFLASLRGKHVAFVGDSMARDQAESLVCLLGSASFPYRIVRRSGSRNRFRRWAFPSHNVTVSSYWAPFLARAAATGAGGVLYNSARLGALVERWSADADTMDVAVVSTGHWFWDRAAYYNGSGVLEKYNHTRIGFFAPYREAARMSLERLVTRYGRGARRTVVVATVSPAHFGKAWDDHVACARKQPYEDGETEVASLAAELRKIAREEAMAAARNGGKTAVKVMDVTKLSTMRLDRHPVVHMRHDPFARGVPERLQSDCLHFCLPGLVDTFNEILQQLLTERHRI